MYVAQKYSSVLTPLPIDIYNFMLPDLRPLDYEYFHGTQKGFIGSVYGDGSTGLHFNAPYRIHLQKHLNYGKRENILSEMEQNYTTTHLYLDKVTQSKYIQNEMLIEKRQRLYDPLYNRLFANYNGIDHYAHDICKSIIYDIQIEKDILFARLMTGFIFFPIQSQKDIQFSNQSNLVLDILPDELYDNMYIGIENYYLKVFDIENNKKVNSYAFKTSDVISPYKWCCIQPGTWQFEKYFVNEKYIYSVDVREKQAAQLIKLNHLKFFGFKKCTDLNYVSLDSEGINLYDTRMISTPIIRRDHEIRNMAPRLYDVRIINNTSICAVVGSQSYPSLKVIEFENSSKWTVGYNIINSDIYACHGDHFAFWDTSDASHLKLLSAVFKSDSELILTYNDGAICSAIIDTDEGTHNNKMPVYYAQANGVMNTEANVTKSNKEEEEDVTFNVIEPATAEIKGLDTDFKKVVPPQLFFNDRLQDDLGPKLKNDPIDVDILPWETVTFTEDENLIIKYTDDPTDMILKYARRFKQMMTPDSNDFQPILTFQDTIEMPPTLVSGISTSQIRGSQEPRKKKKKRGFV